MILFYSGVHRPVDVGMVRQLPVKVSLMGTYFDVRPKGLVSRGGLRMMRRLFARKNKKTW